MPIILILFHLQVAVTVSWEREDEVALVPLHLQELLLSLLLLQGKMSTYSSI
jgi:hypothetical protein